MSISDVTAATGVNRRSIYAEFGSKYKLFERAADRYLSGPGDYMTDALTRSTAREVAEAIVRRLAERFEAADADGELSDVILFCWRAESSL